MSEPIDPVPVTDDAAPSMSGADVIRRVLKTLPDRPGVYRMIDADGQVLYVGKAKSLKKRVASYTRATGHVTRIIRMIAATATMEFTTTRSEIEALLLETNLIKSLKPRFNVLMRDDKSFPYIVLRTDHPAAQIAKHRGARSIKGHYFGPFASGWAVNRTVTALQKAFLLRSCSDSVYESRTRPCLLFQIKRCSAPCTGEIGLDAYGALVNEAHDFLSGKSQKVKAELAAQMHAASDAMEFETAARYRDRLAALSTIQSHAGIHPQSVEEADVFAVHQDGGQTCIEVFFFRTFQNWGNRSYFPRADKTLDAAEVLDGFLGQFYADRPVPRLVLLSHEIENRALLAEALSVQAGHKVEVAVPQRGEKRGLVAQALTNARESLGRRLSESASQRRLLEGLAEVLGMDAPPERIEVYDNSHIMGSNAVGAMIVAGADGFSKPHYRIFNIKSEDIAPGDDYGMMREVMRRRFSRLMRESPRAEATAPGMMPAWPDLVLIDGGAGQLKAARKILVEIGVEDVLLVGIAKGVDRDAGREVFHLEGRSPFTLEPRDPVLYFVQRLRDEAHRFAIGAHRVRRSRDIRKSPLDDIPGIGPRRKRALLAHFGTAKAVSSAEVAELERVEGINRATAQMIHDFFRAP